jgi:sialate O-acetylesterase
MKLKSGILIFFLLLAPRAFCDVKLPRLISDGMVLQRNIELKIWGWASAGEKINLTFLNHTYEATTDNDGKWIIKLPKLKAGGPFEMTIAGKNTIVVKDILIGDVWLCSGQSNMEINMARVSPLYETEIAQADNPFIHYFEVPKKYDFNTPQNDLTGGQWQAISRKNIMGVSAVAYFFANDIFKTYKTPVGLINASLGGSPAEAWLSEEALQVFPEYLAEAHKFRDNALIQQIEAEDKSRSDKWYRQLQQADAGHKTPGKGWFDPQTSTSDWNKMNIPGYWADADLGRVNGVVWFRKDIQISSSLVGQAAKLNLGRIVDADSVFINGTFIGTTSYQYPPRRYQIPAGVLKEGNNTIVVRIINNGGKGGFVPDKSYEIIADNQTIDLKGEWLYKLGAISEPTPGQTFIRWKPEGLYNAMISPLLSYSIKGALWYQGESNTAKPSEYKQLLPALIKNWRLKWQQGDFPFLIVQLANFMERKEQPSESNWAMLREAQLQALSIPNTALAVTIDIGEWNDIHPLNKKDVGHRLALAAKKIAYNDKKVIYSGPVFESAKIEGNKIVISFTNTGGGLVSKDNKPLTSFAIAGSDKKFVWADATIEKGKVIVWSDKVASPMFIRYAWADNPDASLYNKEGLPASSFRTDK